MWNEREKYAIGIDTGVKTGFAIWNITKQRFDEISTLKIHQAMFKVKQMHEQGYDITVRVEDARKRKWFGSAGRGKLQGAGSVKRDAIMWEDFLSDIGVKYEMVAPKDNKTKLSKQQFFNLTKYKGLTSEHSRDSAFLVFGLKENNIEKFKYKTK